MKRAAKHNHGRKYGPFRYSSLVKNWPGGRRKATVLSAIPFEGSAMLWRPIDYKDPEPSQGGMAVPYDPPISTVTGLLNNDNLHNISEM